MHPWQSDLYYLERMPINDVNIFRLDCLYSISQLNPNQNVFMMVVPARIIFSSNSMHVLNLFKNR